MKLLQRISFSAFLKSFIHFLNQRLPQFVLDVQHIHIDTMLDTTYIDSDKLQYRTALALTKRNFTV